MHYQIKPSISGVNENSPYYYQSPIQSYNHNTNNNNSMIIPKPIIDNHYNDRMIIGSNENYKSPSQSIANSSPYTGQQYQQRQSLLRYSNINDVKNFHIFEYPQTEQQQQSQQQQYDVNDNLLNKYKPYHVDSNLYDSSKKSSKPNYNHVPSPISTGLSGSAYKNNTADILARADEALKKSKQVPGGTTPSPIRQSNLPPQHIYASNIHSPQPNMKPSSSNNMLNNVNNSATKAQNQNTNFQQPYMLENYSLFQANPGNVTRPSDGKVYEPFKVSDIPNKVLNKADEALQKSSTLRAVILSSPLKNKDKSAASPIYNAKQASQPIMNNQYYMAPRNVRVDLESIGANFDLYANPDNSLKKTELMNSNSKKDTYGDRYLTPSKSPYISKFDNEGDNINSGYRQPTSQPYYQNYRSPIQNPDYRADMSPMRSIQDTRGLIEKAERVLRSSSQTKSRDADTKSNNRIRHTPSPISRTEEIKRQSAKKKAGIVTPPDKGNKQASKPPTNSNPYENLNKSNNQSLSNSQIGHSNNKNSAILVSNSSIISPNKPILSGRETPKRNNINTNANVNANIGGSGNNSNANANANAGGSGYASKYSSTIAQNNNQQANNPNDYSSSLKKNTVNQTKAENNPQTNSKYVSPFNTSNDNPSSVSKNTTDQAKPENTTTAITNTTSSGGNTASTTGNTATNANTSNNNSSQTSAKYISLINNSNDSISSLPKNNLTQTKTDNNTPQPNEKNSILASNSSEYSNSQAKDKSPQPSNDILQHNVKYISPLKNSAASPNDFNNLNYQSGNSSTNTTSKAPTTSNNIITTTTTTTSNANNTGQAKIDNNPLVADKPANPLKNSNTTTTTTTTTASPSPFESNIIKLNPITDGKTPQKEDIPEDKTPTNTKDTTLTNSVYTEKSSFSQDLTPEELRKLEDIKRGKELRKARHNSKNVDGSMNRNSELPPTSPNLNVSNITKDSNSNHSNHLSKSVIVNKDDQNGFLASRKHQNYSDIPKEYSKESMSSSSNQNNIKNEESFPKSEDTRPNLYNSECNFSNRYDDRYGAYTPQNDSHEKQRFSFYEPHQRGSINNDRDRSPLLYSSSNYNSNQRYGRDSNISLNEEKKSNLMEEKPIEPKYIGEKMNGYRHGQGKYIYSDGSYYDGEWEYDQRCGYGIYCNKHGSVIYDGEWLDDRYHGNGILYNLNIEDYNSRKELDYTDLGKIGNRWIKYEGELFSSKKHGLGTLYLIAGQKFHGKFRNDLAHGPGTYHFPDDSVITGEWENHKFVNDI